MKFNTPSILLICILNCASRAQTDDTDFYEIDEHFNCAAKMSPMSRFGHDLRAHTTGKPAICSFMFETTSNQDSVCDADEAQSFCEWANIAASELDKEEKFTEAATSFVATIYKMRFMDRSVLLSKLFEDSPNLNMGSIVSTMSRSSRACPAFVMKEQANRLYTDCNLAKLREAFKIFVQSMIDEYKADIEIGKTNKIASAVPSLQKMIDLNLEAHALKEKILPAIGTNLVGTMSSKTCFQQVADMIIMGKMHKLIVCIRLLLSYTHTPLACVYRVLSSKPKQIRGNECALVEYVASLNTIHDIATGKTIGQDDSNDLEIIWEVEVKDAPYFYDQFIFDTIYLDGRGVNDHIVNVSMPIVRDHKVINGSIFQLDIEYSNYNDEQGFNNTPLLLIAVFQKSRLFEDIIQVAFTSKQQSGDGIQLSNTEKYLIRLGSDKNTFDFVKLFMLIADKYPLIVYEKEKIEISTSLTKNASKNSGHVQTTVISDKNNKQLKTNRTGCIYNATNQNAIHSKALILSYTQPYLRSYSITKGYEVLQIGNHWPNPRSDFGAVLFRHDRLLVAGGVSMAGGCTTVDILDMTSGEWSSGPTLARCRRRPSVTELGTNVYVCGSAIPYDYGGQTSCEMWTGDMRSNKWYFFGKTTSTSSTPCLSDHAAITIHGKVHTFGGKCVTKNTEKRLFASKFDLLKNSHFLTSDYYFVFMEESMLHGHSAVTINEATAFICGGESVYNRISKQCTAYWTTKEGSCSTKSEMKIPRHRFSLVVVGDQVLAIGGNCRNAWTECDESQSVEVYDMASNKWNWANQSVGHLGQHFVAMGYNPPEHD